jgi:hypothetical protein
MTAALLALLAMAGCRMNIGDSCGGSADCSITGERQCDLTQPGGYCTVFSCDPDTCPEGACVEWRFIPSRTAETWCMKTCGADSSCRGEYRCVFPEEVNRDGEWEADLAPDDRVARITDLNQGRATSRICVAVSNFETIPPESERYAPTEALSAEPGVDGGLDDGL